MSNQTTSQQRDSITRFIQNLGEKNYAEANKMLQKTIENKLFNKIKQFKNINIFKQ